MRDSARLATVLPGTHYAAFLSGSQRRHREPREGPWNPHRHVGKLRDPTPRERLLATLGPSGGYCHAASPCKPAPLLKRSAKRPVTAAQLAEVRLVHAIHTVL